MQQLREAVRPFPQAALFELAAQGSLAHRLSS